MTNQRISTIRRCLGIGTAVSVVVTGACLMAACARIYFTGDHTFTREIAGAALYNLRYLLWISGGLILAGLGFGLCCPDTNEKPRASRHTAMLLKRQQEKTDLSNCDGALLANIHAQRAQRRRDRIVCWVAAGVCGLFFLAYALREGSFHQSEINASMIRAMGVFLPCILIPAVLTFLAHRRSEASMEREIELLKQVGAKPSAAAVPAADHRLIVTKVVFILAVVLLLWGYLSGGTVDVLTKAINICTECVGLG